MAIDFTRTVSITFIIAYRPDSRQFPHKTPVYGAPSWRRRNCRCCPDIVITQSNVIVCPKQMLASIEDLMLDFTLPGYDLELRVRILRNNCWVIFADRHPSLEGKTSLSRKIMSTATLTQSSMRQLEKEWPFKRRLSEKVSPKFSPWLIFKHFRPKNLVYCLVMQMKIGVLKVSWFQINLHWR